MRLLNPSHLGLVPLATRPQYPKHHLTLIAKVVVRLRHDGDSELLQDELCLPCGDVPYPDDDRGDHEPRYPSDFTPLKVRPDIVVVGHYHAPHGPVSVGRASVRIAEHSYTLQITGERIWPGQGVPWPGPEQAQPFEKLQLRWSHAFGGPGSPYNPVGLGMAEEQGAARRLPRIEHAEQSLPSPHVRPPPAGLGAMRETWSPRRAYLGTFDAHWQRERFPGHPLDFDARFFNVSHGLEISRRGVEIAHRSEKMDPGFDRRAYHFRSASQAQHTECNIEACQAWLQLRIACTTGLNLFECGSEAHPCWDFNSEEAPILPGRAATADTADAIRGLAQHLLLDQDLASGATGSRTPKERLAAA